MFENLKQMAMQQLMSKMASNALGSSETAEAATEGANGIMDILKSKVAGGNLDEIKDLFSGGGNMEGNAIFAAAKAKMSETLQAKGMSAEDAEAEAANATPDVLSSLKDKFQSEDAADTLFCNSCPLITQLLLQNTDRHKKRRAVLPSQVSLRSFLGRDGKGGCFSIRDGKRGCFFISTLWRDPCIQSNFNH